MLVAATFSCCAAPCAETKWGKTDRRQGNRLHFAVRGKSILSTPAVTLLRVLSNPISMEAGRLVIRLLADMERKQYTGETSLF